MTSASQAEGSGSVVTVQPARLALVTVTNDLKNPLRYTTSA
jgi:hypothetical protein